MSDVTSRLDNVSRQGQRSKPKSIDPVLGMIHAEQLPHCDITRERGNTEIAGKISERRGTG